MHLPRLLLLAFVLAGGAAASAQPLVVTTNTILADLTRQLTGDGVRVVSLLPSGESSQDFEPGDKEVELLNEARLLVSNGAGYEPWLKELEKKSTYDGPIVVATDNIALYDLDGELHEIEAENPVRTATFAVAVEFDPHAWLDPRNVVTYIQHIRNGLADFIEGESRAAMEERAANLIREVRELHAYAEKQFAVIPVSQRVLVTPHGSLRYFAEAYNFKIVPIQGLASGQELRPVAEARLVETIRGLRPPAVFFETTANVRQLRRLTTETGVKMVTNFYTTDVGPANSKAATYTGLFRSNVDVIVEALRDPNAPGAAAAAKATASPTPPPPAGRAGAPASTPAAPVPAPAGTSPAPTPATAK